MNRSGRLFTSKLNGSSFPGRKKMVSSPAYSLLLQLRDKSSQLSAYAVKQARALFRQLMERNQRFVVHPASKGTCHELSQKLWATRLASVPYRYKALWEEAEHVKRGVLLRREIKLEEIGVSLIFLGELYSWLAVGEVVGRGNTITGYYVDNSSDS